MQRQDFHSRNNSRALEILVQLVMLKLKLLAKQKLRNTHLDFLTWMQQERNLQENKGLRLIVSSEKGDDECTDVKRVRVVPKHDKLKWDLAESLDKYRNKHCNKFIPEYHLQETFLVYNPVILTSSTQQDVVIYGKSDILLKTLQPRGSSTMLFRKVAKKIMEPLFKVWTTVEKANRFCSNQMEI